MDLAFSRQGKTDFDNLAWRNLGQIFLAFAPAQPENIKRSPAHPARLWDAFLQMDRVGGVFQ
jgi:hypothetical protein